MSSSDLSIRVEGLGKQYRLGLEQARGMYRYKSLRDSMGGIVKRPLKTARAAIAKTPMNASNSFWALKDLSFEVKRGEVVGIIGRNGAGKSTLLKILSKIAKPTTGQIELRGRVGSLLEVGTGFHPELSGRENIFLNGAVLGMTRAEVRARFDEIVAFSEVERFLETPVKHYSSGMYMRLAFAIAAHLEPEILVVDEVLAVGDAQFQKKCIGKMKDVAGAGRTVLFVSHSLPALARLCSRAVLLEKGELQAVGEVDAVIRQYTLSSQASDACRTWPAEDAPGDDIARLRSVSIHNDAGQIAVEHDITRSIMVQIEYELLSPQSGIAPNFHLWNAQGDRVFVAIDTDRAAASEPRSPGRYCSRAIIPANILAEGSFTVSVSLSRLTPLVVHANAEDVVSFDVIDTVDGHSARGNYTGFFPGVMRPKLEWEALAVANSSGARV